MDGLRSFVLRSRIRSEKKRELVKEYSFIKNDISFFSSLTEYPKVNLEIGFGDGGHIFQRARLEEKSIFLGCEVYPNGISQLVYKIKTEKIPNILIHNNDARELLENAPNDFFSDIYILFPDPWHKKKHHKRRLINTKFISLLFLKMKPSSRLLIATDCVDYYNNIVDTGFDFQKKQPEDWISTKYEKKALKNSNDVFYLTLYK
ncbi:tRNA (guanine-N(7)-)-methyltransferase [Candidatus Cyrtobacter comes]|uniref:tRNA (guanine-N(7)-)-methyltransferase n=1 Tax=Candidatus Cyrtobacter comes TaxID=675776 RepID=A0ABU5L8L3_9RICK|nr:hypothetical protein [Candidatus Cyrtobacter comes]MDZ5762458.1 tRNA (guanine-N(7)-)-methyltransferase [Candidatus Cyrtobacter comes]